MIFRKLKYYFATSRPLKKSHSYVVHKNTIAGTSINRKVRTEFLSQRKSLLKKYLIYSDCLNNLRSVITAMFLGQGKRNNDPRKTL